MEQTKVQGHFTMRVVGRDGKAKRLWNENKVGRFFRLIFGLDLKGVPGLGLWDDQIAFHNLVTTVGKQLICQRLNGFNGPPAAATYIAVGTGATAPAAGDTILQTETASSGLSRAAATPTNPTTGSAGDTMMLDKTFSVTGTVGVTEAGVFNAASAGTLLARQTFSAVNVVNGDTLQVQYKIQMT